MRQVKRKLEQEKEGTMQKPCEKCGGTGWRPSGPAEDEPCMECNSSGWADDPKGGGEVDSSAVRTSGQHKPPTTGIVHRVFDPGYAACHTDDKTLTARDPEDMTPRDEFSYQWENTNCAKCWEKAPDWAVRQFPDQRLAALGEPNTVVGNPVAPAAERHERHDTPWVVAWPKPRQATCTRCEATIGYHLGMLTYDGAMGTKDVGRLTCPVCEKIIYVPPKRD